MLLQFPKWAESHPALVAYQRLLSDLRECRFIRDKLDSIPNQPYYLIATGKAAVGMAEAVVARRGDPIAGFVVTKGVPSTSLAEGIEIVSGGHPIPTEASLIAGEKLVRFCQNIPRGSQVLFLLSGGSSALVEQLADGLPLSEFQSQTQARMRSGQTISELNQFRKSVSQIKGGKLAQFLGGCDVHVLVLSDVPCDDLSVIGSGPLYPHHPHTIVANQDYATKFLTSALESLGLGVVLGPSLTGDLSDVAERYAALVRNIPKGTALVGTGESTITITGNGTGGRCQHFALQAAIDLENTHGLTVLAGSTDGTDGPTDYAGAIINGRTLQDARDLNALAYLDNFDSNAFLAHANALIVSGATQSNIYDVVIAVHL